MGPKIMVEYLNFPENIPQGARLDQIWATQFILILILGNLDYTTVAFQVHFPLFRNTKLQQNP